MTLTAEEKARVKERKALEAQAPTLRRLRDEAIANIGWVAGNAYGHPIWPEVEPFIGPGGTYYEILLRTGIPGSDPEIEVSLNVQRYREAFDRGKAATFNEAEGAVGLSASMRSWRNVEPFAASCGLGRQHTLQGRCGSSLTFPMRRCISADGSSDRVFRTS